MLLGSTGETDAKKAFPSAELKSYKGGGPLLIDAVLKGHADIGVNDSSAVVGQMANFPPNSLKIFPGMLSKLPLAFAVRYDSMDLLEWINLFFLHINLDGTSGQEHQLLGQYAGLEKRSLKQRRLELFHPNPLTPLPIGEG